MRDESGFTLAELLVSMAITLVVVGTALTTFSDAMFLNQSANLITETNQNMRAGLSLMTRDLMQTGQGVPLGGIPIPGGAGALPVLRPSPPGFVYSFPADPTIPSVTPGDGLGPAIAGQATDAITILYGDSAMDANGSNLWDWPLAAIANDGSSMTVDARTLITNADRGLRVGDLIMFSNGQGNALQQVTRLSGGQTVFFDANDSMQLNQRNAPEGTIIQLQDAPGSYPDTTATRVVMLTYYIDWNNGEPQLIRQVGDGPRLAVALGVENLQFAYDLVDGVTNPTNVATPIAPNSPNQIRKVSVFLSARSDRRHPQTGNFFRNSMTSQVSMRSLSFFDRYP